MKVAVCDNGSAGAEQLCAWIAQYGVLYHLPLSLRCFLRPECFASCCETFNIVFLGFGGSTGFLAARALRDRDRSCRIILIDDTPEYAIRGVRIHCTDFILRPVEFRHVVRSMRLATGGWRG